MSYETPSQPRVPVSVPTNPSHPPRPETSTRANPAPAWRRGKCLACLGRGSRTVYRPLGDGVYLPRTIRCERCEGTGTASPGRAAR